jgi:SAM-dependent methyltransferase
MFQLEDHYWWFVGRRYLATRLAAKLAAQSSRSLQALDLGCGTGAATLELAQFSAVTALDMNEFALQCCRRRGIVRTLLADGQALPFVNERFDVIMGLDIFEHIPDDDLAFRECARVLRPDGLLVLSVPAFRFLWGPHDVALHHFRRYRRAEIEDKLQKVGLRVEQASYSVFLLFPLVLLSRLLEKLRRGPPHASLPMVPGSVNRFLTQLQQIEANWIIHRRRLPWGSSVIAVARKPAEPA